MFTGIIEETGIIIEIKKNEHHTTFKIKTTPHFLSTKKLGQSIAVNGVCISLTKIENDSFTFDAISETLSITTFAKLQINEKVNLEESLKLNQGLDGHLVQGHVDTRGKVIFNGEINGKYKIRINFPENISQHLALKGSITINGVSLTISELEKTYFGVDLIPHTLEKTNLGNLKQNDEVNLEVDMISKYLERLLQNKEQETKYQFLVERNFI